MTIVVSMVVHSFIQPVFIPFSVDYHSSFICITLLLASHRPYLALTCTQLQPNLHLTSTLLLPSLNPTCCPTIDRFVLQPIRGFYSARAGPVHHGDACFLTRAPTAPVY